MDNLNEHLKQQLREQIALEEHLFSVIKDQIAEVEETDFIEAKNLLIKTRETLEKHFLPLNEMLDSLEKDSIRGAAKSAGSNGSGQLTNGASIDRINRGKRRISRFLRDDYSALNLITMSNTLLHTVALALNCPEVAAAALRHLGNLAPLVVSMGELVPEMVARELQAESSKVDISVAKQALKNIQLAWSNIAK